MTKTLDEEASHYVGRVWLTCSRESICLDVAWTWKVNWHEPDVLPVAKLEETNRLAGQSERFGPAFLDDVWHNHGVVLHQAQYPRLELRQEPSYTWEHCLHLQHIDVLVCLLPGQCPLQLMRDQLCPHLWLEAPVKRVISASKALSETPCSTAGEDHQAPSWRIVRVTEILSDQDPVS